MAANRRPPARSVEGKEAEMVYLAVGQAEQMLRECRAPSQIVSHYLKLGTRKYELEIEQAKLDLELTRAKTEAIQAAKDHGLMFERAIEAMKEYGGAAFSE